MSPQAQSHKKRLLNEMLCYCKCIIPFFKWAGLVLSLGAFASKLFKQRKRKALKLADVYCSSETKVLLSFNSQLSKIKHLSFLVLVLPWLQFFQHLQETPENITIKKIIKIKSTLFWEAKKDCNKVTVNQLSQL